MNRLLNSTGSDFGYGGYGGNFLDVLFKHLLEKGLSGLTFMTIFNLYLYLSLDKIKEFMKWLNEHIQEYFKKQIYEYYTYFYNLAKIKTEYLYQLAKKRLKIIVLS